MSQEAITPETPTLETPTLETPTTPETPPTRTRTPARRGVWVCETCKKVCETLSALNNHVKVHEEKSPKPRRNYKKKSPLVTTPQVTTPQVTTPQVTAPQVTTPIPLPEDDDDDDEEYF